MTDYSENSFSSLFELETTGFKFPEYLEFYLMSRIPDLTTFYEGCLFMSIKTSNNQEIINRMPFQTYLKLTTALDKYVTMENKANNGDSGADTQNQMDSVKASSEEMMNKAKTNFKMPSLPKFK